jgi:hypothetical protein
MSDDPSATRHPARHPRGRPQRPAPRRPRAVRARPARAGTASSSRTAHHLGRPRARLPAPARRHRGRLPRPGRRARARRQPHPPRVGRRPQGRARAAPRRRRLRADLRGRRRHPLERPPDPRPRRRQLYAQSLARLDRMRRMRHHRPRDQERLRPRPRHRAAPAPGRPRLAEETGARVRTTCLAAHALPAELRGSPAGRAEFVRLRLQGDPPRRRRRAARRLLRRVLRPRRLHPRRVPPDPASPPAPSACSSACTPTSSATPAAPAWPPSSHALSADHLLHLDDDERAALRDAGVVATLLPGTSLVLGKPFADGRALVRAGVPVAVATDCNPGSCALESLALVLALACYGCKLSPAEALCAVTHNAAASLGLAARASAASSPASPPTSSSSPPPTTATSSTTPARR